MLKKLFGVGDLGRAEFARWFVDLGRREGVLNDPVVDMRRFSVRDGDVEHRLASHHAAFRAAPRREREQLVLDRLAALRDARSSGSSTWQAARERLRPRLRSALHLDLGRIDAARRGSDDAVAAREIGPGLYLTLALDAERSMTAVSERMLAGWGASFDEALSAAMNKLAAASEEPFVALSPGLWIGAWDDGYAASRALLHHRLQGLTSDPLVAVPDRDVLLVASARNDAALTALVEAIASATDRGSHPLSPRIFQLRKHELAAYVLPEDHPASVRHHNLCALDTIASYAAQQAPLQELLGESTYVATADADEADGGRLVTRTLWSRGTAALLPATERIVLLDDQGEAPRLWVCSAEQLATIPGALEPTDHACPRLHTRAFPSAEALAALATPVERDPETIRSDSSRGLDHLAES